MSSTDTTTTQELTEQVASLNLSETPPTTDKESETKESDETQSTEAATEVTTPDAKPAVVNTTKKAAPVGKKAPAAAAKKGPVAKKTNTATTAASTTPEKNSLEGMNPTEHISRSLGKKPEGEELTYKDTQGVIHQQTSPPTIPVMRFYADADVSYPEGEFQEYTAPDHTYRITSEECHEKDLLRAEQIKCLREGATIHRQVRQDIQKYIQPGVRLIDIAEQLERSTLDLVGSTGGPTRTRGFPTGLSLNHIAAHFTPNPGDKTVLKQEDVLKIDFGVSIDGNIIDCAWTTHFEEKYDPIVEAAKAATEAGIKTAGIDVRLCDVGGAIREVMESYEMDVGDGKGMLPIKSIKNLCGHSIGKYKIHDGHSVPSYDNNDQTKMTEGVLYAIETFATNDPMAKIREDGECSHYMLNFDVKKLHPRTPQPAVKLWNAINKRFSTLAFCRRWLVEEGLVNHQLQLYQLSQIGAIDPYPPLVVRKNYQTSQFEHTILLGSTKKEVLSRSWDY